MSEKRSRGFTAGSVPEAYDRLMAPQLFEPWARELVGRAQLPRGSSVLDVASGSGTVARLAALAVGPDGRVVASDISAAMLGVAAGKPVDPAWARIEYLECSVAAIEAADGSFDAVLCQQGLQFFPDRGGSMQEMCRVTRRDGVVWSRRGRANAHWDCSVPRRRCCGKWAWTSPTPGRSTLRATPSVPLSSADSSRRRTCERWLSRRWNSTPCGTTQKMPSPR